MVTRACNLSTPEVTAGGPEVQDHYQLHGKFKASLSYKSTAQKIN